MAFAGPAWAVPVASFTYSPTGPLTSETVTFSSTSTGATSFAWDLDGDGLCDDASGTVVTGSFPVAGIYSIKLCVSDGILNASQEQQVLVHNRPPVPSFGFVPAKPVAKELITFTSTAVDPDGPIVAQAWDFNGDGVFDNGNGETALFLWRRPGTYPVALRVTDRDGATAVAHMSVVVAPRPPGILSPAPIVRVVGAPTPTGARLDLLTVTSPKGAHVGLRCRGASCPYGHKRFTSKGKRVTLRKLARTYPAGTVIEVRVTRSETIGKFTRLRIRAGKRPARLDRCLPPGRPNKLISCSS